MRFAFTAEQLAFRDAVRDLLAKECTPEVVRAAWEAPVGQLDRTVWDGLDDMGALAVLAPETAGGLGLDFVWLVLLLEETGRAALPHPVVETAAVAAPLGVTGRMVTTSLGLPGPGRSPGGDSLVPCAADADAVLVDHDGALRLFVPEMVQFDSALAEPVDRSRRVGRVVALGPEADVLSDDPAAIAAAFDRGALGTAAQLNGLGQAMLDLTVAYVKDRQQFGVPIGSFQAIKHHVADALLQLEFARRAVYRASWSIAVDAPTATRDVSMAKAMASDAAVLVGRKALQCHGAIGYTVEHDLHLFLKRAWALGRAWGDSAWHRERVAHAILPNSTH